MNKMNVFHKSYNQHLNNQYSTRHPKDDMEYDTDITKDKLDKFMKNLDDVYHIRIDGTSEAYIGFDKNKKELVLIFETKDDGTYEIWRGHFFQDIDGFCYEIEQYSSSKK